MWYFLISDNTFINRLTYNFWMSSLRIIKYKCWVLMKNLFIFQYCFFFIRGISLYSLPQHCACFSFVRNDLSTKVPPTKISLQRHFLQQRSRKSKHNAAGIIGVNASLSKESSNSLTQTRVHCRQSYTLRFEEHLEPKFIIDFAGKRLMMIFIYLLSILILKLNNECSRLVSDLKKTINSLGVW